jgi:hypothetical protein
MAVVLAYVDAVPGRLYPLVPTMQELVYKAVSDEIILLAGNFRVPQYPSARHRFRPFLALLGRAESGRTRRIA